MMGSRVVLVDARQQVVGDNAELALGQAFTPAQTDLVIAIEVNNARVGDLIIPNGNTLVSGGPGNDLLERVNAGIWLAALVAGLVALVAASATAYSLVRPIQQVTEAAGAIALPAGT